VCQVISEVNLRNFQSFGAFDYNFDLRPITLIFGPNGAGKSALFRSLLFLSENFNNGRLASHAQFKGEEFDLLSATNVMHGHSTEDCFLVGVKVPAEPPRPIPGLKPRWSRLNSNFELPITHFTTQLEFNSYGWNRGLRLGHESFRATPESFFEKSEVRMFDEYNGCYFEENHPGNHAKFFREIFEHLDEIKVTQPLQPNIQISKIQKSIGLYSPPMAATIDWLIDNLDEAIWPGYGGHQAVISSSEDPNYRAEHQAEFEAALEIVHSYFSWHSEVTRSHLNGIHYIGPLREIKQTLEMDFNPLLENDDAYNHVTQDMSFWLEKLTNNRFSYREKLVDIQDLGTKVATRLIIDKKTNTPVRFSDVGVGLSQILPIVEALHYDGQYFSSRERKNTLLVEQPELHLHPRMQADIADMVIDAVAVKSKWQQVILETHSEAVILRIQRRIAEGKLDPELVSVIYVDTSPNVEPINQIQRLPIDETGTFIGKWPESFVDVRLRELSQDGDAIQ
jgi:predicted ATPase